MLKELFLGSTDFTEVIFKYPKYQKISVIQGNCLQKIKLTIKTLNENDLI